MRDSMRFVNHLNEEINFGRDGILINENDFRNYAWTYKSQFKKVTSWERDIKTHSLPITVYGDNRRAIADNIFETIEKDVLANKPGYMYVGDYYLKGYFYASAKSAYTVNTVDITLSFVTDQVKWIKQYPFVYRLSDSGEHKYGLDFPYNYKHDYTSPISIDTINNGSFTDANFEAIIFGPAENPQLNIGEYSYKVDITLTSNEYLVLNTRDKTIVKTDATGIKTNCFPYRDMDTGYIFQPIAPGENVVSSAPLCNLNITVLEERSEPKWT